MEAVPVKPGERRREDPFSPTYRIAGFEEYWTLCAVRNRAA
jgi:hypothetical protein